MESIWKPNPEIVDYYARIPTEVTGGRCPLGCAMRRHVFTDTRQATVPPFVVYQHALGCMFNRAEDIVSDLERARKTRLAEQLMQKFRRLNGDSL